MLCSPHGRRLGQLPDRGHLLALRRIHQIHRTVLPPGLRPVVGVADPGRGVRHTGAPGQGLAHAPPCPDRAAARRLFSGVPSRWGLWGVAAALLVVDGLGEETGWRGFALPALQRRHSPLVATLLLTVAWAGWHAPMFVVVDTYHSIAGPLLVGWFIGLFCGAVVLTWLYNRSGSILLVAIRIRPTTSSRGRRRPKACSPRPRQHWSSSWPQHSCASKSAPAGATGRPSSGRPHPKICQTNRPVSRAARISLCPAKQSARHPASERLLRSATPDRVIGPTARPTKQSGRALRPPP
ncbi:CPBP family intramembrane glutamic endopeptidase [Kitasatospora paracochleata]|uniref:CPBP family intramembrane glutamic endopeptidase n=1 Tax=Kitasatospora paracochleata TaxID=58354 RepID=UPI003CD06B09